METGLRESRKHAAWYMRGLRGAARLRQMAGQIAAPEDIARLGAVAAVLIQGGPGKNSFL
jgi:tRNA-dihydrouridine synthase